MTMTRDEVLTAEEVEGKDKKRKEELEKEAEEYAKKNGNCFSEAYGIRYRTYIDSAEPREKQIQIDAEQIRALQKQIGELTDRVRELEEKLEQTEKDLADYQFNYPTIKELEAQIEKMKCWCNCKNYLSCLEECCRKYIPFENCICYNCKKWELRR